MRISDWSSDVCSSDLIGADQVLPDQRLRSFVDRDAVGVIAIDAIVCDDVVDAVTVDDDAGQRVVISLVVDDPAVVDFARYDDAVLFLDVVGLVAGDEDRTSVVLGKSVYVHVDPGGRRLMQKQKKTR